MNLSIQVPIKANIVFSGIEIPIAPKGVTWSKTHLGTYADRSGVYIHHREGEIIYVGKTTVGNFGTFGERMRREFQETSSSNSDLYRLLLENQGKVKSVFFDLDDIDLMVQGLPLSKERKALILEQVLIGTWEPIGNKV